jgi:uncharacterized sulfatase
VRVKTGTVAVVRASALLAALYLATPTTAQTAAHAAPNIVLFLADDQTWIDSGAYGNDDVPTPNIDRLARQGVRFTHAFTGTAMCAPTRQQLYTGLYPTRSGAYPNHSVVQAGTRSLVHHFRDLGYRVGLAGKEHFGPPASFPFERVRSRPKAPGPATQNIDIAAVQAFITRDPREPFLLVVAANSPHTPWTEGNSSDFDPDGIAIPGYLVDTAATREALTAYYAEITHLDQELGLVLEALATAGREDDTIVLYTSEQGASLPFAKWTLYDAGVRTAMVVRWPGRAPAGSVNPSMIHYVDVVPTLVDAAGGPLPDVDGRSFLASLTDNAQEHREYVFGVQTTRGIIHGSDFPIRSVRSRRYKLILNLAAANGFQNLISRPPRDTVLASWNAADPRRARAYTQRPEVEFYDLQADPWELTNLADHPKSAAALASHRRVLEAWMRSTGDRGLATEREALDHMHPGTVARIRARFGADSLPPASEAGGR